MGGRVAGFSNPDKPSLRYTTYLDLYNTMSMFFIILSVGSQLRSYRRAARVHRPGRGYGCLGGLFAGDAGRRRGNFRLELSRNLVRHRPRCTRFPSLVFLRAASWRGRGRPAARREPPSRGVCGRRFQLSSGVHFICDGVSGRQSMACGVKPIEVIWRKRCSAASKVALGKPMRT
jgi:hypothetical protein